MTTIKQYILDNYEPNEIKDITTNGCIAGVAGLTYYHETVAFHDKHEEEIWDMLYHDAENITEYPVSIMEFIAGLNGHRNVGSLEQLKNLLTWYAVESKCHEIVNENESF